MEWCQKGGTFVVLGTYWIASSTYVSVKGVGMQILIVTAEKYLKVL
jgi:hypothetical protein